ncbi:MAG: Hint domain-containing protein [Rhodobacteraceae bacterium]|jgi:hypothetical protein|nr:Hint domain-containing protein [Paracoccaceae bacterium]
MPAHHFPATAPFCQSGFTAGTLLLTPTGPAFVEDLCPGDLLMTRDQGPQPLRGLARGVCDSRAITIAPEAMAPGLPWRPLRLSRSQRVLMAGWKAGLLYGVDETLVPVGDLVSDGTILARPVIGSIVTYQPLFDRPQVIWAEGIEVEVAAMAHLHTPLHLATRTPASAQVTSG